MRSQARDLRSSSRQAEHADLSLYQVSSRSFTRRTRGTNTEAGSCTFGDDLLGPQITIVSFPRCTRRHDMMWGLPDVRE